MFFALIGVICLCILFTAFEKWTWTTLSLLVTGGIYFYLNKVAIVAWVLDNWQTGLYFVGAYLIAGVLWSFGKWFFFLIGFRDEYRNRKTWFCRKHGHPIDAKMHPALEKLFTEFLRTGSCSVNGEHFYYDNHTSKYHGSPWTHRPLASENKSRITGWIGFWPFSMIGTVINDPLRKVIDFTFNWFKGLYQRMSDYIFRQEAGLQ